MRILLFTLSVFGAALFTSEPASADCLIPEPKDAPVAVVGRVTDKETRVDGAFTYAIYGVEVVQTLKGSASESVRVETYDATTQPAYEGFLKRLAIGDEYGFALWSPDERGVYSYAKVTGESGFPACFTPVLVVEAQDLREAFPSIVARLSAVAPGGAGLFVLATGGTVLAGIVYLVRKRRPKATGTVQTTKPGP